MNNDKLRQSALAQGNEEERTQIVGPQQLNGLFLLEAVPDTRQVSMHVMYHGEMFLLNVGEPSEVLALLGATASRLIVWQPCGFSDDVSGIWSSPSFKIPDWVLYWPAIKHMAQERDMGRTMTSQQNDQVQQ